MNWLLAVLWICFVLRLKAANVELLHYSLKGGTEPILSSGAWSWAGITVKKEGEFGLMISPAPRRIATIVFIYPKVGSLGQSPHFMVSIYNAVKESNTFSLLPDRILAVCPGMAACTASLLAALQRYVGGSFDKADELMGDLDCAIFENVPPESSSSEDYFERLEERLSNS